MKITIYKNNGETINAVKANDDIFSLKENKILLAEAVRCQLSRRRSSIADTKQRDEVSGGGKKPWRQKGTGRARAGSSRSPIWRGGGITFGPTKAKNYSININKKSKIKARNISLSQKAKQSMIFTITDLGLLDRNKFLKLLSKINLLDKKILLVTGKDEMDIYKKSRNITGINNISLDSLNTFDILDANAIVWSKKSFDIINKPK